MSTRPPHPPVRKGRLADLWRRARLTLAVPRRRARSPIRVVTFPLRADAARAAARLRAPLRRRGGAGAALVPRAVAPRDRRDPDLRRPGAGRAGGRERAQDDGAQARRASSSSTTARPTRRTASACRRLRGAQVELLEANGGFAKARQPRHRAGRAGDDVVVLNSDVIARPGWLERLQYTAYRARRHRHRRAQAAVSRQADPVRRLLPQPRRARSGSTTATASRTPTHPEANITTPVIGGDRRVHVRQARRARRDRPASTRPTAMAYEDMDWCLRGWKAGYRTYYSPRASLIHLESQTRPTEPGERELASQRLFWQRWSRTSTSAACAREDGSLRIVYVTEDTGVGGGHRDIFEHLNRLRRARPRRAAVLARRAPGLVPARGPDAHVRGLRRPAGRRSSRSTRSRSRPGGTPAPPVWLASMRHGIPVFFVQDIETSLLPRLARRCRRTCSTATGTSSAT